MTAINAPLTHGSDKSFWRGMLVGIGASAVLVAASMAAALSAGLLELPQLQAPAAPAAPVVESYPDFGVRHAPAVPVETYTDFGVRHAPAQPATQPGEAPAWQADPGVAPRSQPVQDQPAPITQPVPNTAPGTQIDQYNPIERGPHVLY